MVTLFSKKQIPTSLNNISNYIKSDLKLFENEFDDALKSKVKLIQTISRFIIKQRMYCGTGILKPKKQICTHCTYFKIKVRMFASPSPMV